MKDRPIIFSSAMVSAILEGRKTQTRRVIKPQPSAGVRNSPFVRSGLEDGHGRELRCPYGRPGDKLWVRETWGCKDADRPGVPGGRKPQPGDSIQYAENGADAWQWRVPGSLPWRPSIHMPRWASRILLEITDVRVQRVQGIVGHDVLAEGIPMADGIGIDRWRSTIVAFRTLWDSINAKRGFGWDSNPWVWALTFKRVEDGE